MNKTTKRIPVDLIVNGTVTAFDLILINQKNPSEVLEIQQKLNELQQSQTDIQATQSTKLVNSADYDTSKKQIIFYNSKGVELCHIDASDFVKDGMVDTVVYNADTNSIVITFNTDAGKKPITLGMDQIISDTLQSTIDSKVDKSTTVNGHKLNSNVTISKSDVGLGNVANVSTDSAPTKNSNNNVTSGGVYTELERKVDKTTSINGHALSANVTVSKSDVGLGNVTNVPTTDNIIDGGTNNVTSGAIYSALKEKADKDNIKNILAYGVQWDTTKSTPDCTRIGNPELHRTLPIQESLKGCIFKDGEVKYYLDPTDWTKKADGSGNALLDGTDGDVMVHHMRFYGYSEADGDLRRVWISTFKISDDWQEIPEGVVSAYRLTTDASDSSKVLGRSVINTTTAFRGGGNRTANDAYLDTDPFRSDLGKPRTNINRRTFRTYVRNNNLELLDYETYKWVFFWLPVIEYSTFDMQRAFNASLTTGGLHQGGLGPGVTNVEWNKWGSYNGNYPIVPCGYTNEFGNQSGVKDYTFPIIDGTTDPATSIQVNRYRGIEQPFGDVWTNLDGVLSQYLTTDTLRHYYVTDDPEKYSDSDISQMRQIAAVAITSKYVKEFVLGSHGEIVPLSFQESPTQYKCDYHWDNTDATLHTLLVGGYAHYGAQAGLGCLGSSNGVGIAWAHFGFRASKKINK